LEGLKPVMLRSYCRVSSMTRSNKVPMENVRQIRRLSSISTCRIGIHSKYCSKVNSCSSLSNRRNNLQHERHSFSVRQMRYALHRDWCHIARKSFLCYSDPPFHLLCSVSKHIPLCSLNQSTHDRYHRQLRDRPTLESKQSSGSSLLHQDLHDMMRASYGNHTAYEVQSSVEGSDQSTNPIRKCLQHIRR
jgi:hypothetical protein